MAANYLHLPGLTGNYASVPDVANLDGSGTLEFIMKVALDNWTLDADQVWISKWTGTAGYKFSLRAATNDLRLRWNPSRVATATVTPTVTDGDWLWVRAVATENGADRDVIFYTSTDETNDPDLVTWTQLGAKVVAAFGAGDLTTNTSPVFVGALSDRDIDLSIAGSIAAARINFNGVTELDIDFTDLTVAEVDAGSFIEDSGNAATVTIAGIAWAYVRPISVVIMQIDASTLTMVYDTTKRSLDPAIDIDTAELIRFELFADVALRGEIWQADNPVPWWIFEVQPGSYTQVVGGPVVIGEVPRCWMGTI